MDLKPLKAEEITEAGAYEWVDEKGIRHVGFLRAARRGNMSGSFISEEGAVHGISLMYGEGTPCQGTFFGPLPSATVL